MHGPSSQPVFCYIEYSLRCPDPHYPDAIDLEITDAYTPEIYRYWDIPSRDSVSAFPLKVCQVRMLKSPGS